MARRARHLAGGALVKPVAVFYGYVLGYVIGVRWNLSPTGGMGNPKMGLVVRKYLDHTCGADQWARLPILDVIRDRGRNAIRELAEDEFPSLFGVKGRQRPLQIPDELKGQDIKFDLDLITQLKDEVASIKKEIAMSTESTNEVTEEGVDTAPSTQKKATTIVVPPGVDVNSLTLDNFRQLTGKRFRMTKEQRAREQAGQLTREQALEEFKTNVLGGGGSEEATNE